jgi:glycosyltransferase involved in cell wall biosynthesis
MHGKIMQAMYAKKPIVAMNLDPSLRAEGIYIEASPESFAERVLSLLSAPSPVYQFDFSQRDWSHFKRRFIEYAGL